MPNNEITTVFYSWQSDLPSRANRNFIENALRRAVKAIRNDDSINVHPQIDRDTLGKPGAVEISSTIYDKIKSAAVFVADVSIINYKDVAESDARPVCNPNVLLELGYAMGTLGHSPIVMVFNKAYGKVEDLPFDLRSRRAAGYHYDGEGSPGDSERELAKTLETSLRDIFAHREVSVGEVIKPATPVEIALQAVEAGRTDARASVRRYNAWLLSELESIDPFRTGAENMGQPKDTVPLFLEAIDNANSFVADFGSLVDAAILAGSPLIINELYKGLWTLAERFMRSVSNKPGMRVIRDDQFDFFRFVGNQMFTLLIARLLKEREWETIATILGEQFTLPNFFGQNPGLADYSYFALSVYHADYFNDEGKRLRTHNYILPHGLLVSKQFEKDPISSRFIFREYVEADFFLYIRSWIEQKNTPETYPFVSWADWTRIHLQNDVPSFLLNATKKEVAEKLALALAAPSVGQLRVYLTEIKNELTKAGFSHSRATNPLFNFDPSWIGKT